MDMSLEEFVHTMERRIFRFGQSLWPVSPATRRREEMEQLAERIRDGKVAQTRLSEQLVEVRQRVVQEEMEAAMLGSRIETYLHNGNTGSAWQHALSLEEVHQALRQDRLHCERLEEIYQRNREQLQLLQDRLAVLRQRA
jgi:hypothetical protein